MLDSFKQLEMDLEGGLNNMKFYHAMSNEELSDIHKDTFDGMYEESFNYRYEYDREGKKFLIKIQ